MIVASYNSAATIAACLEALNHQTVADFEVIVVDSSTDSTPQIVAERFPRVRLVRCSSRLFPGDARNLGMSHALGSLIAFVDSDCVANPDWVEQLLDAHSAPNLIVGGSVGTANPESGVGWSSYFCEFSPWMRAGKPRLMPDIPTCCYSFKREAFARFGPFLAGSYCSDTLFNMKATAAGFLPLFIPSIHVRHMNPTGLRAVLGKLRMHGRTYALVRARQMRFSGIHAMVRAASFPLLPPLLWLRNAGRVLPVPGYRKYFLLSTPFQVLTLGAWALGEASGYWSSIAAD